MNELLIKMIKFYCKLFTIFNDKLFNIFNDKLIFKFSFR